MKFEQLVNIKLYNGDCMEVMQDIPDKSIDAIIADLPYGTTNTDGGRKLGVNGLILFSIYGKKR